METFPTGACFALDDLQTTYDYGVLRTDMAGGWAKQRPTRTRPVKTTSGTLVIEGRANYNRMLRFIDEIRGAGEFWWIDPDDGKRKVARFSEAPSTFEEADREAGIYTMKASIEVVG